MICSKQSLIISFFLVYGIFLIWFYFKIFKDPKYNKFILGSLTDPNTKEASGKSLTALMFSQLIMISTIFAIVYSDNHILPEYFLYSILGFIASVYGIKLAGKISDNKNQTSSSITSTTSTTEEKTSAPKKDGVVENKEKEPEI
jgi:hypothetical protein